MILFQTTTQTVHVQPLQPGHLDVGPFSLRTYYVHPYFYWEKLHHVGGHKSIEHDSLRIF